MHDVSDDHRGHGRNSSANATHNSDESMEQEPGTSAAAAVAAAAKPGNGETEDDSWKKKGEIPEPIFSRAVERFERKRRDKDSEDGTHIQWPQRACCAA